MSSPTSSPAAMMRRTWAPSLVCCCTCQRKISPTLMCTRSRPAASMPACVPLPLPWTPSMTYLRTTSGYRAILSDLGLTVGSRRGLADPEHPLAQPPQLGIERIGDQRPVGGKEAGVDEASDVVALALGQQHAVHAAPGRVVADVALTQARPRQVHGQHHHAPGR